MFDATIIGDPHAVRGNLEKIGTLFDIAEDLGEPTIILGDLLDTKELIRGKVFNYVYKRLKESKIQWYILVGNHDWFNLTCEDHSLQVLKELPNVTVVDKLIVEGDTAFMPFQTPEKIAEMLNAIPKKVKYLFAHLDVVGFDFGNGIKSQVGLKLSELKRFDKVITGHYHTFAQKKNLTYLGTPFSHTFGETNQDKFIGSFVDGELGLLPTPFPKHLTFEIDCNIPEEIEWQEEDIVRVFLDGTQDAIAAYPRQEGVKYLERPTTEEEAEDSVIDEIQTPAIQFSNWATKIRGIEDEAIIEAGVELLKEVANA